MGKEGYAGRTALVRLGTALLLLAAGATASGQAPATIVLAGDRAYPPFQFQDAAGHADGFDVALFRAVAAEAGFTAEVRLGDWEQSLLALEAGRVDVVPMFVTPERARRFLFSRPFLQRHHLVFARRGSRFIATLEELRGATVAVQNASLAAEALAVEGGPRLVPTATEAEAIGVVARSGADFALVPTTIGYLALLDGVAADVVAVSPPLLSLPYAFGVAPSRPGLVRQLDEALARVQAAGTSDRLWLAWLANLQPPAASLLERWTAGIALFAVALLLGFAAYRVSHRRRRAEEPDELPLMRDLRAALATGEVGLAVQPKLDLASGAIAGAELLVRWQHPGLGALPPSAFLPQAEYHGLLRELSLYMVARAVRLYREWHGQGLQLVLSVNVSIADLADATVVDSIIAQVRGLPHMLRLEITEDTAMHSPELVLASLVRLRENGVGISLDDFGTGHSTLSRLRRLGPEELKIDRSFVTGLLQSPSDQSIVRSSIALAHELGARFIAEGVEDQDTLDWLAAAGADEAQGFVVAAPMPPAELPGFCLRHVPGSLRSAAGGGIAPRVCN